MIARDIFKMLSFVSEFIGKIENFERGYTFLNRV
jgi:hypothetical protein